jgi:hypothetical protein
LDFKKIIIFSVVSHSIEQKQIPSIPSEILFPVADQFYAGRCPSVYLTGSLDIIKWCLDYNTRLANFFLMLIKKLDL